MTEPNRLSQCFQRCRQADRAALILYACAGYPDPLTCEQAIENAIRNGADIIELGVPFSDPMADGPVICAASARALEHGQTLLDTVNLGQRLRQRHPDLGLILFSYMNPILNVGCAALCELLKTAGFDGLLAVDLPLEERDELLPLCRKNALALIPLVPPGTPPERIRQITAGADGFVYAVSVRGTTGVRRTLAEELAGDLQLLRKLSPVPVAVGFGIGDAASAAQAAAMADGVIVGSAFLQTLSTPDASETLVRALRQAVKRH